jgi:hypothetical protein
MQSGWVKEEYYRALDLATKHGLQLIPVLYKQAQIPGFLSNRNWVDFRNESEYHKNVHKLIWGITGKRPVLHRENGENSKAEKDPVAPSRQRTIHTANEGNIYSQFEKSAGISPHKRTARTSSRNTLQAEQIKNPFIRYLERKLRMENAHWIRAGMNIPAQELNFTAIYFQAQAEIFTNLQSELYSLCDKLEKDEVAPTQDPFIDIINRILQETHHRVTQIQDLLGPVTSQYEQGIILNEAAKTVEESIKTVKQAYQKGARALLANAAEYDPILDDLITEVTSLAISIDELQKYLVETYHYAVKERILLR